MDDYMQVALEAARKGYSEGGIPIGSVLVCGAEILGVGYNRRVQEESTVLHAEIDALRQAGRQAASFYPKSTLYTTLSPCSMCSGAIRLFRIPRVVIGENRSYKGDEQLLIDSGVQVEVLDDEECYQLMQRFIQEKPELWNEDIGKATP
jgi:cytosine deaminase